MTARTVSVAAVVRALRKTCLQQKKYDDPMWYLLGGEQTVDLVREVAARQAKRKKGRK